MQVSSVEIHVLSAPILANKSGMRLCTLSADEKAADRGSKYVEPPPVRRAFLAGAGHLSANIW